MCMMKARRNITIDAELDKKLRQNHINASGLINELLKAYYEETQDEQ